MNIEEKLIEWEYTANELKLLRKKEADMRRVLVDELLKHSDTQEGRDVTEFVQFNAVVNIKVNRNVDDAALTSIINDLSDDERASIVYKPSLDMRRYRKLPDSSILHSVVTAKPGMPTLKLDWIPEGE